MRFRGFDTRNSQANFVKNYFQNVAIQEMQKASATFKCEGGAYLVAAMIAHYTRKNLKVTEIQNGYVISEKLFKDVVNEKVSLVSPSGEIDCGSFSFVMLDRESMKEAIEECLEEKDMKALAALESLKLIKIVTRRDA